MNSDSASVYIIAITLAVIGTLIASYRAIVRKIKIPGTSVLLAYYAADVNLTPIDSGMFGDMHYSAISADPKFNSIGVQASSLIYMVALPYRSYVHLVGIPKKTEQIQLAPDGRKSIMEKVVPEGDYPDYFTLYAEKGMQVESRYVLDPKAMVFTIDFCQSFNWEIVDNQLYFVKILNTQDTENISMPELIEKFVNEIKPAIARPLTKDQLKKITPYSQEYRNDLKCPICKTLLKMQDDYLICPNGDGVLLKGDALIRLNSGHLKISKSLVKKRDNVSNEVICPYDGTKMEAVGYDGSKVIINSCPTCPYRWLDANDLHSSRV